MPEASSQVIWHDIPGASPPWDGPDGLLHLQQLSSRVGLNTIIYDPQKPELLRRRYGRERWTSNQRIKRHLASNPIHWGVVGEPYMTPLLAFNLLLQDFGVPEVTSAEAQTVVDRITEYYMNLTQSSQPVEVRRARRSRGRMTESLLTTLTASQVNLTQQSTNAFLTDIQDALVLEVLSALCAPRGLRLNRMPDRDLRRLKRHLGPVDVSPRRRAIIVADRHEPTFAVIYGVPRLRDNSHAAEGVAVSAASNSTPASGNRVDAEPYLQLLACAKRPVPWRRMIYRRLPRFTARECAVAFVERVDERDRASCEAAVRGDGDTLSSDSDAPITEKANPPDVKRVKKEAEDKFLLRPLTVSSSVDSESLALRKFGLVSIEDAELPISCKSEMHFKQSASRQSDPLLSVPRTPAPPRNSLRRHWLERLLPAKSTGGNSALARLYSSAATDY